MAEKDRKKEINFTNIEIDLLLHLCNNKKHILENMTSNALIWKLKIETWEKIHEEFNSAFEGPCRTIRALRTKYNSIKKQVRRSVARQKMYIPGKGKEIISPALEQLHQNIKISSDMLIYPSDSESYDIRNLNNTDKFDNHIKIEEVDDQVFIIDEYNTPSNSTASTINMDLSDYSASILRTIKPKELKDVGIQSLSIEEIDKVPTTSTSLFNNKRSKRKATVSNRTTKYNNLCTLKEELVQKELQILAKKEEQDNVEHELRAKKLKLQIEKLELETFKLKKSIQS